MWRPWFRRALLSLTLSATIESAQLINHVDPFVGTEGIVPGTGYNGGNTFPGAAVPWGMVKIGPDLTSDVSADSVSLHYQSLGTCLFFQADCRSCTNALLVRQCSISIFNDLVARRVVNETRSRCADSDVMTEHEHQCQRRLLTRWQRYSFLPNACIRNWRRSCIRSDFANASCDSARRQCNGQSHIRTAKI